MAWYWILRRNYYQNHPHGIANYADKAAALMAAQSLEELKQAESGVHGLLGECKSLARKIQQKWNKLRDLGAPDVPFSSPIRPEHYEDLKLRISRGRWELIGLFLGEGYLNYLSLLVLISSDNPFLVTARAVIAAVFTLVAFKVFHSTLEAWDPEKAAILKAPFPAATADAVDSSLDPTQGPKILVRVGMSILALATLVFIAGITTARARDFEGGPDARLGIVGIGFILASLILPIIAGIIHVELGRMRPLYQRMRKWRRSLIEVRQFERQMNADLVQIQDLLNKVETHSLEQAKRMYAGIVDFKVTKDNRDRRKKMPVEDLQNTFAESIQKFTKACMEPYYEKTKAFKGSIDVDRNALQDLVNRSIEISSWLAAETDPGKEDKKQAAGFAVSPEQKEAARVKSGKAQV